MTNIGLDCGALAPTWLTNWERRVSRWAHSEQLLVGLLDGIGNVKHGIAANAILLNPASGEIRQCPPPHTRICISHLSMLFGFPEIFAELIDYMRDLYPAEVESFMKIWMPAMLIMVAMMSNGKSMDSNFPASNVEAKSFHIDSFCHKVGQGWSPCRSSMRPIFQYRVMLHRMTGRSHKSPRQTI